MPDTAWKVMERRVAALFCGQRNPLSGGTSRHTRGDVIHDALFIECKLSKRNAMITLMHDVETKAKKEGKLPLLALHVKAEKHDYLLIRDDLAEAVLSFYRSG